MKLKYIILPLLAGAALLASCSDYLEEYSQDTSYVRGYEDLDELLLGDCYLPKARLAHIGFDYSYTGEEDSWYFPYIHLMGDETQENINTVTSSGSLWPPTEKHYGYYTWQKQPGIDPDGTTIRTEDGDWKRLYYRINIANMVIANIDEMDARNNDGEIEKRRIKGEAAFLRAAYYFALVNLYAKPYNPQTAATDAGVPLKNTEYIEDRVYSRNTVEEVYQQIIADLKAASQLLEGTTRKTFYRADQNAADLLLSRVYLYMQDYDNAAACAEKVLARKSDLQNLNTMNTSFFLNKELCEIIFDMGNGGLSYSINEAKKTFGVSDYLCGLYNDPADLRAEYFVKYDDAKKCAMYVKGETDASNIDRTAPSANFLFRTAELYLNAAEAYALKGDNANAQKHLNALRQNRMKADGYQPVTLTGNELIDFIREERARELCLEGHRWFDLRRYSVNAVRQFTKSIRHSYTTWEYGYDYTVWNYVYKPVQTLWFELQPGDEALTLPIPREVINFNIGMENNPRPERLAVETVNY